MPAKLSEQSYESGLLLDLNRGSDSFDLSDGVRVDPLPFGAELLTCSSEYFGDSIAETMRGYGDSIIFNDRLPIVLAA